MRPYIVDGGWMRTWLLSLRKRGGMSGTITRSLIS